MERSISRRGKDGRDRGSRGGSRPGSGRPARSVNEWKKVARARAAREDKLPHELLREWATTGVMKYPKSGRTVDLDASERITCARSCASWYQHAKAPVQPADAPAPVLRIELDPEVVSALARENPDRLEVLRDLLRAIQAGGGDLAAVAAQVAATEKQSGNARRYAKMLADGEVAGAA